MERWKTNICPLFDEKKSANKHVCHACKIRVYTYIQSRDQMFRSGDKDRFNKQPPACQRLATPNGISSDPSEIVCEFPNYFQELTSSRMDINQSRNLLSHIIASSYSHPNSILSDPFENDEIIFAITRLKCDKAASPDSIRSEHIKYGGHSLAKWFTKNFNRIITL